MVVVVVVVVVSAFPRCSQQPAAGRGLVVNAGGKAIAAKQRRWRDSAVVKEGRVNGAPRLQILSQPRAEAPRLRSASAFLLLRQWAGDPLQCWGTLGVCRLDVAPLPAYQ